MDYETQLQPASFVEIDWEPTFEAQLADLAAPFSSEEVLQLVESARSISSPPSAAVSVTNPAKAPLPEPLREFLRWAKGRDFHKEERQWEPIFTPRQIREYMIEYGLPLAHPTKLPIGMDGGGCFYMIDLAADSWPTYLVDPAEPLKACGLLAHSLWEALADGRSQIEVAGL